MGRPGLLGWVAIGSSLLIIPVVVLLGTYVITPHGEPTDFDSVIRRMGFECNGEIAVPPALKDEVGWAGFPCQTPAGDVLMYLVTYVVESPGAAVSRWLRRP
jgi:hypothetical protein